MSEPTPQPNPPQPDPEPDTRENADPAETQETQPLPAEPSRGPEQGEVP